MVIGGVLDQGVRQPVAACGGLWRPAARESAPLRRIAQSCWGPPDGDDKNDDADDDEDEDIDSWDV